MAMAALALHQPLPWRTRSRTLSPRSTHLRSQKARLFFTVYSSSTPSEPSTQTAESCVNTGLSLFKKGRVKDALLQFESALDLNPNPKEAQVALYNKACCHAYRGEGRQAVSCLRTALRDYNLKFSTILNDPDLASFRASPEFKELQDEARQGGEDIGYGFRRDLKLISEVQAPFRGVRRFFYVALSAAAGISMFFTVPRFIRAINGGEGAPDIWETAGNAAINIGGIVILVALFIWDNKKEEEQLAQISRDETLSRLPLRLSTNRIVELVQLRDSVRPVILAGNKETVTRAIEKAERFRTELVKRGVILAPVIWGENRKASLERKGFGLPAKAATSLPSIGEDFDKRTQSITAKSRLQAEVRFKAEIVSPNEWERWIRDQQKSEGVNPGDDVYIILRLDGRVRRSGKGMPDWQEIVKELPLLENLLSKLER
ncbi:protein LOW PSII ACCUMULATION 1, chloroplastic isoform X1 [Dioscorea cayenensis subsp. rotundata]|uniref:Protein LOW PSII ACCUMULATION 1, chloroplastic isoform X1 n=1 Tax=Dioscorea cayennensis subsp. rotundata TaxID=55577 RepID=A0AB40BIT5_DIOCR|nr:protein LOW PSII ACCUMULATION 1, chloroplastic isoform X1 [Dioscorea cayenensis subsp. rotundata]